MNFGRITVNECVNVAPESDVRCQDAAFALANPDICPATPHLIVKPGLALACSLGSTQFKAFLVTAGLEHDVSDDCVWTTSNSAIALIGAGTGNATGLAAGTVTISATYETYTATAELTILAASADCCVDQQVAMMLVVDNSRSMSRAFSGTYATRLDFARAAAARFAGEVNATKDLVGLISFNDALVTPVYSPTSAKADVAAAALAIAQSQQLTSFYDALSAAIDDLDASGSDRRVIVLVSDGEDTSDGAVNGYVGTDNPIALLSDFKASGGFVICLGCRASITKNGFAFLSTLATGGFFLNAYEGIEVDTLDYLSGLKGYLCAGNCTPAGDEIVGEGQLNYSDFINWNVTDGNVDLMGNGFLDLVPGNGLYVDLAGSGAVSETPNPNGRMVSKVPFSITSGQSYRLSLELAGNQRETGSPYSVQIQVFYLTGSTENVVLSQTVTINDHAQLFKPYSFTFTAPGAMDAYIAIRQIDIPDANDPNFGILLGRVVFTNMTTVTTLLDDDFDDENQVYVPPACGQGTIYYGGAYVYGYNCYGEGCLDTPPPAQLPDPTPLDDIESGYTPPTVYTSTKTACATCGVGFTNVSDTSLVPVMTAATAPSGEASANSENALFPAWKAFSGNRTIPTSGSLITASMWAAASLALPAWLRYDFDVAVAVADYEVIGSPLTPYPKAWLFQGSNDGSTWTTLDSQSAQFFINPAGEAKRYATGNTTAYLYYRLYITAVGPQPFPVVATAVIALNLFAVADVSVCASASGTGASQHEADTNAYAAALALAQTDLNCLASYTATEQVTIKCPTGTCGPDITKSATKTSYISQDHAESSASNAAAALAQAEIDADCTESNNDQYITISDATATGPTLASLFPSVKFVEGVAATTTKVTVTITGLTHTYPKDIQMFLMGPTGVCVGLMRDCGSSFAITGVNLVLDDAGGALPTAAIITSGTYAPTAEGISFWQFSAVNTPTAPAAPAGFLLSAFNGLDPNGAWSLWIIDKKAYNSGFIAGGWDLTITP